MRTPYMPVWPEDPNGGRVCKKCRNTKFAHVPPGSDLCNSCHLDKGLRIMFAVIALLFSFVVGVSMLLPGVNPPKAEECRCGR